MNRFILFFFLIISSLELYSNNLSSGIIIDGGQQYLLKARNYKDLVVYDSAELFYSKSIEEFRQIQKWDEFIIANIELGNLNRIQGKTEVSWELLNNLVLNKSFELESYPNGFAEYLHLKATLIGDYGDFEKAIIILDSVVEIRSQYNPADTALAKTYNNLGAYYYFLNKLDKASELYEKALETENQRVRPKPEDIASYNQNIGNVHSVKGDYDKALIYYNKSLELNKDRLASRDPEIADVYLNLALTYFKLGQFSNVLKYNHLAEEISLEYGKDFTPLGYIYNLMGSTYRAKRDIDNAEIYFRYSVDIFSKHLKSNHDDLLTGYYQLGRIELTKGELDPALEYFHKSYELSNSVQAIYRLRDIAIIYHLKKDKAKSEEYITRALAKFETEFKGYNSTKVIILLSNSELLLDNKQFDKALERINEAISISLYDLPSKTHIAACYNQFAKIQMGLQNFNLALEYFHMAMIENDSEFSETNKNKNSGLNNVASQSIYLSILLGKANAFSKLYSSNKNIGNLSASVNCFVEALDVFEEVKSEIGEESRIILANWNKSNFENVYDDLLKMIEYTNDKSLTNVAFKFAEKFKAASLLSNIKAIEAIKFGGIPFILQEKEKLLNQRIAGYKKLMYDEQNRFYPDSSKQIIWQSNLFDVNREYNELIKGFKENYPGYYDLNFDKQVISLTEVQSLIEPDQVLLEYVLTDNNLYTIVIQKDSTKYFGTKIGLDFYHHLEILEGVAHTDFSNHRMSDYKAFIEASQAVYQTLIAPVAADIKDKRIIVVPDGRLGYLPFETLITKLPSGDRMDYRNLAYLIKENPISYSYSSSLLYRNYEEPGYSNKLLAFAPKYNPFSKDNKDDTKDQKSFFMPLVNAITEVENISDLYSGDVFIEEEATESKFKEVAEDYDIIHLAMHTVINDEKPMYSKLVFSNSTDSIDDRYLNTFELYGLELKAKMAVLSACNTGSGKIEKGEGIMSLARGFIYAGIPSIVMTLWEVEDKSGADIMTLFYQKLKMGMPKDIALQQAKLDYLKTATQLRSHPYFWLAYVDIGNTKAFKKSSYTSEISYSIVVILIILFVTVLRKKHKKKSTI